jgi:hypothetical protein
MYSSTAAAVLRRAELSLSGEGRQQKKKSLLGGQSTPRNHQTLLISVFFPQERERERKSQL